MLVELTAESICAHNSTYRNDALAVLKIQPDETYPIASCTRCDFVFAVRSLSDAFLTTLYETVIDAKRGFEESTSTSWQAHQVALASTLLRVLAGNASAASQVRVLDFGCGYGSIVQALQGPRIVCYGYEASEIRCDYLRSRGLPTLSDMREVAALSPYAAIVLSEVLEHVPEPRQLLRTCRELLSNSGHVLISVPNFAPSRIRWVAARYKRGQPIDREVNPWEYLSYFSAASLRTMLRNEGFQIIEVEGNIDVGLRAGLSGLRRLGNGAKSMLRLLQAVGGGDSASTVVFGQRA